MINILDRITGRERDRQARVFEMFCDTLDSSVVEMGSISLKNIDTDILSAAADTPFPPGFGGRMMEHPEFHNTVEQQAIADLTGTQAGVTAVGEAVSTPEDRAELDQYKFYKYLKEAPDDPEIAAQLHAVTPQGGQLAVNAAISAPVAPVAPMPSASQSDYELIG